MFVWLILLFYQYAASYIYNLEEIEHLKYGIDINSAPILRSELTSDDSLIMRSKYKQEYRCSLPHVTTKDQQDLELETVLSSFATKFNTNQCVHRTKGWWTYRVCYGSIIQQYHQPDRRKQTLLPKDVTIIGVYEKDTDWNEEISRTDIRYYEQLSRTHKQHFRNGDICDETGLPRKAVVSFACDPDADSDFIALIDEREICSYKIVIHTHKMCRHDFFMPGHASVKHRISCNPIVNVYPTQALPVIKKEDPTMLTDPNWVGANPTSDDYSLKEYLADISDEKKQAPIRALKKMFKDAVKEMKTDLENKKTNPGSTMKNPALEKIDLEDISDEDLNNIFQSEELEGTINKLAKSTQQELETYKKLITQQQQQKSPIEVKVIYRDADGNVKMSNADGDNPDLRDTILKLVDHNHEMKLERRRHQSLQNGYNFMDNSKDDD